MPEIYWRKAHGSGRKEGRDISMEGIEVKHRVKIRGTNDRVKGLYLIPCTLNLTPFSIFDDRDKFI